MISERATDKAAWLMSEFAMKTGLSQTKEERRRYLWTDAFAVCNFLELFERTGDEQYRRRATELVDQVHRVLGRYRDDDIRSGWISGSSKLEAFIQRPAA
jgi:rhamnogalacturonyl hydrolase YesR